MFYIRDEIGAGAALHCVSVSMEGSDLTAYRLLGLLAILPPHCAFKFRRERPLSH
jgi:hypothetical protein